MDIAKVLLEFLGTLLLALGSGAVGAAIINGVNERKLAKMRHVWEQEAQGVNDVDAQIKTLTTKTDAQSVALRYIMYDRIRFLGQAYIAAGSIDFDDRRILNDMHTSYHDGLGGNGDLDKLMETVNALPLKMRDK